MEILRNEKDRSNVFKMLSESLYEDINSGVRGVATTPNARYRKREAV